MSKGMNFDLVEEDLSFNKENSKQEIDDEIWVADPKHQDRDLLFRPESPAGSDATRRKTTDFMKSQKEGGTPLVNAVVETNHHSNKSVTIENPLKAEPKEEEYITVMLRRSAAFKAYGTIMLYDRKSLFFFPGNTVFRQKVVSFFSNKHYERFIFLIVILSSLTIASFDYKDREQTQPRNKIIRYVSIIFTLIFTFDSAIRIIGMGFILHKNAYLRDVFGWMDLLVILQGYIDIVYPYSPTRFLITLRPLRLLNMIKSLRKIIKGLVEVLPDLANVGLFLILTFICISSIGVNLYKGVLYDRCSTEINYDIYPRRYVVNNDTQRGCSKSGNGFNICPKNTICGDLDDFHYKPEDVKWEAASSMQLGNWDALGIAMITGFIIFTSGGWSAFMLNLMDADTPIIASLFSIFLLVFFNFIVFNLLLAITISGFTELSKLEDEKEHLAVQVDENREKYEKELDQYLKSKFLFKAEKNQPKKKGKKSLNEQNEEYKMVVSKKIQILKDKINLPVKRVMGLPEQRSMLQRFINGTEELIEYINSINGSFEDPKEALKFAEPTFNVHRFSKVFLGKGTRKKKSKKLKSQKNQNDARGEETFKIEEDNRDKAEDDNEMNTEERQMFANRIISRHNLIRRAFLCYIEKCVEVQIRAKQKGVATPAQAMFLQKVRTQEINLIDEINLVSEQIESEKQRIFGTGQQSDSQIRSMFLKQQSMQKKLKKLKEQKEHIFYLSARKENCLFRFFNSIIDFSGTQFLIGIAFAVNVAMISKDEYPTDKNFEKISEFANFIFVGIMLLEFLIMSLGRGKMYFKDIYYIIDLVLLIFGGTEVIYILIAPKQVQDKFLLLMKSIRILRIFKVITKFKKFRDLLGILMKAVQSVGTYLLFLCVLQFTWSCLGMEFFAFNATVDGEGLPDPTAPPNSLSPSFDDFLDSFTTTFDCDEYVFQIHAQTSGLAKSAFFVCSWIVLGQKLYMNLFLATLLESWKDSMEEVEKDQLESPPVPSIFSKITALKENCCKKKNKETQNQSLKSSKKTADPKLAIKTFGEKKKKKAKMFELTGQSLFFFDPQHRVRVIAYNIISGNFFNRLINFTIFVSLVVMAIQHPLNDPNGSLEKIMDKFDIVTTTIFTIEMILKIIVLGFAFNGPFSFIRDIWNVMDGFTCVVTILALTPIPQSLKIIKIFRIQRSLKFIQKSKGLKLLLQSMFFSIPNVTSIFVIFQVILIIFSVNFMTYMKGAMNECLVDNVSEDLAALIVNKFDCLNSGGDWVRSKHNFDNLGRSLMAMYQFATNESWNEIYYPIINAVDADSQPIQKYNPYHAIYLQLFSVLQNFIVYNVMISVIISSFNKQKDIISGDSLINDTQKEIMLAKILSLTTEPIRFKQQTQNKLRLFCIKIYESRVFQNFLVCCVIVVSAVQCSEHYHQPVKFTKASNYINDIFNWVFFLEAIIKIIGMGKAYFKDGWNVLDFFITIVRFVSQIITATSKYDVETKVEFVRNLRMLRLINRSSRLTSIFNSIMNSIPGLVNTATLWFLIIYIYSIIGIQLFSKVARNDYGTGDLVNFESFQIAFLSMFSLSLGDAGPNFMLANTRPYSVNWQCVENPTYEDYVANDYAPVGCGIGYGGLWFFYSYFVIVNMILLNLVIGIIIGGYEETKNLEERLFKKELAKKFQQVWSTPEFDPTATGFIPIHKLLNLLFALGEPLGLSKKKYEKDLEFQYRFISALDLPIYNNFQDYYFQDVLQALAQRLMVQDEIMKRHEDLTDIAKITPNEWHKEAKTLQYELLKLKIKQAANPRRKIEAYQIMLDAESKFMDKYDDDIFRRDLNKFTSPYQAVGLVVTKHMKYLLQKRRFLIEVENMHINLNLKLAHVIKESEKQSQELLLQKKLLKANAIQMAIKAPQVTKRNDDEKARTSSTNDKLEKGPSIDDLVQEFNELVDK